MIVHALYLKTEEILGRSLQLVLNWAYWYIQRRPLLPNPLINALRTVYSRAGGDQDREDFDVLTEENLRTRTPARERDGDLNGALNHSLQANGVCPTFFLALLVGEVLTRIGLRDHRTTMRLLLHVMGGFEFGANVNGHYEAFRSGQSHRDMVKGVVTQLLEEYGTEVDMVEVLLWDFFTFKESLLTALNRQMKKPIGRFQRIKNYFEKHKSGAAPSGGGRIPERQRDVLYSMQEGYGYDFWDAPPPAAAPCEAPLLWL